ncbi:MAG: sulfatase-like hydrolase/transferase [Niabella sp.]
MAALLLFIGMSAQQKTLRTANKPNVIFIMADDLGRGMLSYYGQKKLSTPRIDQLATQGASFTNAYASAYCAPSRAAFITGYCDIRRDKWVLTSGGIYSKVAAGIMSDEDAQGHINNTIGEEPDITYLPQIFKQAGYTTAQIGKLEYGFTTTSKQMNHHGWDYYFGYFDHQQCHGYYPMILYENDKLVHIPGNTHFDAGKNGEWDDSINNVKRWNLNGKTVYSQDLFLQKIISFIRANKSKPFFLYHPTQLPHGPVSIPAVHPSVAFDTSLTQIEKEYASMVIRLDEDVNRIMQELAAQGIADNTVIIFTSDNGHEIYYSKKGRIEKPYRNMTNGRLFNNIDNVYYATTAGDVFDGNNGFAGLKRSNLEGGVRVPLFIYWPQKIKAGLQVQRLVTNYDFMATITDLLKVNSKDTKDGISYLPDILGKQPKSVHQSIVFSTHEGPALITKDGWKLRYIALAKKYQLFNINNNYKEDKDVAAVNPVIFEKLKARLIEKCDGDILNGVFSDAKNILKE